MKNLILLLFLLPLTYLSAQITEESPGWYNGENVHQKDIDSLFKANPKAEELSITYLDSTLVLPDFTELEILGIRSESLQNLQFPALMPNLGLLDLSTPILHNISASQTPELFELMIQAQLDSFPAFVCNSPELTLVSISNYKVIPVPGCLANLFIEDKLEISTLEIYDKKDGNLQIELKNPSYDEQAAALANESDEMEDYEDEEDFTNFNVRGLQRRIFWIRRGVGLVFAGLLFLIVVR
jgi:hypothetical protein